MTSVGIDEVLNRLSIKFNRIIYDRDFVECVSEDLQTVIDDKHKCCVLVFPALSPNYLRLVKYQAKLCDLAVIPLGSGSAKSVGVCHKKYFLPSLSYEDLEKHLTTNQMMAENSNNATTRKKRPPIQLYVPPAQRKARPNLTIQQHTNVSKKDDYRSISSRINTEKIRENGSISAKESQGGQSHKVINDCQEDTRIKDKAEPNEICYCTDDIDYLHAAFPFSSCNCAKLFLFKHILPNSKLLMFSIRRINHSFHWAKCLKQDNHILVEDELCENRAVIRKVENLLKKMSQYDRVGILTNHVLDFRENQMMEESTNFENNYCLYGNSIFTSVANYILCGYHWVPEFLMDYDNCLHCLEDIEYIHKSFYQPKAINEELEALLNSISQMELNCDNKVNSDCAKLESGNIESSRVSQQVNQVIVLDERIEPPNIDLTDEAVEKKNKQNEHEQEKEIMRRTKQNINRKTRPIIKYVDDDNDTLKIGRNDNINNWEELLNDDGELQEEIFREIVQKVGSEVTIIKAAEDYSAYGSKQLEELEHMVELYDFPPTLETRDIMAAFSGVNSDAMYVKWVDDTHALLVLGSYSQAQKAIELANSMIKVRPMSVASKLALEKANQYDLKPAMKRPQTNLQTARRLITSHLGAKSRVSKEQSAKEREDLRLAKELKRQAKQNEKDAWEGNLRSSIN